MGLETATYINGLNSSNPLATDSRSQGDDHLRLIKSTIKATFPNITGAVTATHTQLNQVAAAAVKAIIVDVGDDTTSLTAGTAKKTFRMPFAMTLTDVRASVKTAPTGATLLAVDVNEEGVSILSTKLTFDSGEKTTTTATTPRVISDSSLADDAEITIDIDAVGNTIAGVGLRVYLIGTST